MTAALASARIPNLDSRAFEFVRACAFLSGRVHPKNHSMMAEVVALVEGESVVDEVSEKALGRIELAFYAAERSKFGICVDLGQICDELLREDSNGRRAHFVLRSFLKKLELATELWSLKRVLTGLGAGNFLEAATKEAQFMSRLTDSTELLLRMEAWCDREIALKRLERGSFAVLKNLWFLGGLERSKVLELAFVKERQGRQIVSRLVARNVIVSEGVPAPLRLRCPADVAEVWFPGLLKPDSVWV